MSFKVKTAFVSHVSRRNCLRRRMKNQKYYNNIIDIINIIYNNNIIILYIILYIKFGNLEIWKFENEDYFSIVW
jgi:hypothetical protein